MIFSVHSYGEFGTKGKNQISGERQIANGGISSLAWF